MSKRPAQLVQTNTPFDGLVRLWMLRILVKLKAHKDFLDVMGYENSAIACYLGLQRAEDFCDESLDPSSLEFNFDAKKALAAMRQSHLKAKKIAQIIMCNQS